VPEDKSDTEGEMTEALVQERRFFRPLPELVANANINPVHYDEAVKKGIYDLYTLGEEHR